MKHVSSILGLILVVAAAGALLSQVISRAPSSGGNAVAAVSATPLVVAPAPIASSPVASAVDPPLAAADCPDPVVLMTSYDRASEAVTDLAGAAKAVFQGTITAIGPPEWNTRDGKPGKVLQATDVRRMATIRVDAAGKGVKDGSTVTVALPGGTIGCDHYQLQGLSPRLPADP